MAIENWLTGREMHAIAFIVNAMTNAGMELGETGGDVLRIPMSKLKEKGYDFLGCDISSDCSDLPSLRESFRKIDMNAQDTEESTNKLAEAVDKVLTEIEDGLEKKPETLRDIGY